MKPGDTILVLVPGMPLHGKSGRIVEVRNGHIMATVGDDPRPLRLDFGSFTRDEPEQTLTGAE